MRRYKILIAIVRFLMKNELSWIPFANGSEAVRGLCGGRRHASGQADAIRRPNVDRERERGNCASFILEVDLVHTSEA